LGSEAEKIVEMGRISAKGGITLFFGLVLSTVISTTGTIIVARMLAPADYGLFAIAMMPPTLFGLFRNLGLDSALVKYLAQYKSENQIGELKNLIVSGILVNSAVSLFLSIILYFSAGFIAVNIFLRPELKTLIEIASVNVLAICLFDTSQSIFTGFEKFEYRSFLLIFQSTIQTFLAPWLVYLGYGVFGVVLGVTLAFVMASSMGLFMIHFRSYKKNEEETDPKSNLAIGKTLRTMLSYGYPLGFSAILLGFLPQFYNFLVAIYCSNIAIGNYQIAAKFIVLINFFTIPISVTLFPAFSKLDWRKETGNLKKVFQSSAKYAALLTIPIVAAIAALSEPLILLFFGEKYSLAPLFLALSILSYISIGFGSSSSRGLLNGQGLTKSVMKIDLVSLAFGIPLSLILIPQFGIIGLIITSLIATIPSLLIGLFWIYRRYRFTIDWAFSLKTCLASAVAATIAYVAIAFLNQPYWIELIVGGLIFSSCYLIFIPTMRIMNLDDVKSLKQIFKGLGIITYFSDKVLNVIEKILKFKSNSFFRLLRSSKRTILLMLITVLITIVISAVIAIGLYRIANIQVPSLGTVKALGVEAYWDRNLENKIETIDWGTIQPGSSKNVTLYLQSISNIKTTLYLDTTNWNPQNISDYMNLSWNYDGAPINPGEVTQVTLTLSASSSHSFVRYLIINDVEDFSFDITIGTTEYTS